MYSYFFSDLVDHQSFFSLICVYRMYIIPSQMYSHVALVNIADAFIRIIFFPTRAALSRAILRDVYKESRTNFTEVQSLRHSHHLLHYYHLFSKTYHRHLS